MVVMKNIHPFIYSDELHAVVTVDEWRDVLHDHHGFSISTSRDQLQEAVSYKLRCHNASSFFKSLPRHSNIFNDSSISEGGTNAHVLYSILLTHKVLPQCSCECDYTVLGHK